VVRKEYTDLRDSTCIDFNRYFGIVPNSSRDVNFDNGSKMMFRHAGEIGHANLKNMSLDAVFIEQGEELEDDEAFTYLRDRMRGKAHPRGLQQINIIANCRGHNWLWRRWLSAPESDEFHLVMATTFDNAKNLPPAFVADMKAREVSEPSHYRRMVMNSFDEDINDDQVLTVEDVEGAMSWEMPEYPSDKRQLGVDVARYGEDETVFCVVERKGLMTWYVTHVEATRKKSLVETSGKVMEMCRDMGIERVVIDDDGIGGGVTDFLGSTTLDVIPYKAVKDYSHEFYVSRTTEAYFKLKDWMRKGWLKIPKDEKLREQLLSRRFKYNGVGKKVVVSKDEMRKEGIKSPDRADALMMAIFYCDVYFQEPGGSSEKLQQYAIS
jgi:hypothetical protein